MLNFVKGSLSTSSCVGNTPLELFFGVCSTLPGSGNDCSILRIWLWKSAMILRDSGNVSNKLRSLKYELRAACVRREPARGEAVEADTVAVGPAVIVMALEYVIWLLPTMQLLVFAFVMFGAVDVVGILIIFVFNGSLNTIQLLGSTFNMLDATFGLVFTACRIFSFLNMFVACCWFFSFTDFKMLGRFVGTTQTDVGKDFHLLTGTTAMATVL